MFSVGCATHPSQPQVERLATAASAVPTRSPALIFDWPIDQARLTRGFIHGGDAHEGLDLAAPRGTDILAAHDGRIIYVGRDFRGYGKMIILEHDSEWATLYAHLDRYVVREGQFVKRGHVIGKMGATGRSTGVHLHFEVRRHRQAIDPLTVLPKSGTTP